MLCLVANTIKVSRGKPSSALSAGIFTTSLEHATHFRGNAAAGMVNHSTAGADAHFPFCERKGSSCGPCEKHSPDLDLVRFYIYFIGLCGHHPIVPVAHCP